LYLFRSSICHSYTLSTQFDLILNIKWNRETHDEYNWFCWISQNPSNHFNMVAIKKKGNSLIGKECRI